MFNGVVLIDKPVGLTSFGVVARIKRVLKESQDKGSKEGVAWKTLSRLSEASHIEIDKNSNKRVKVGHTGTLDPFASGLMILVLGDECKNASRYSKLDKVYKATITIGATSTTGDTEGDIKKVSSRIPDIDEIEATLAKYKGKISQKPPIYSAIKLGGKRAYKRARDGEDIEMPSRDVMINELKLIDYNYPEIKIETSVSSGTYIRSLAVDIGDTLDVGAYCSSLRRVSIADYKIKDAVSLSEFGIVD